MYDTFRSRRARLSSSKIRDSERYENTGERASLRANSPYGRTQRALVPTGKGVAPCPPQGKRAGLANGQRCVLFQPSATRRALRSGEEREQQEIQC
eukprot:864944-Pleurochrysis_carterae.AAC.1